jgi:hypothetical protein
MQVCAVFGRRFSALAVPVHRLSSSRIAAVPAALAPSSAAPLVPSLPLVSLRAAPALRRAMTSAAAAPGASLPSTVDPAWLEAQMLEDRSLVLLDASW